MQQRQAQPLPFLSWLSRAFFSAQPPLHAYALAALMAVLFIAYLFPLSFLAGNGAFFEQMDAPQHVTGWLFYARDTWHFPLLYTERLNHPDGVNIAFTDSIPLAALLFKTIVRWLPAHFHYIGLWHVVVFVTQALAATFLIRALGARHLLATLSAVIFALTWPALLWRLGHTSLMTHGILLFALAVYFLGRQGRWRAGTTTAAFIAISVIGLMVHPYFLAFCYALFLAFLADQAIAGGGWKKQLPQLLASVCIISAAGALLGYFGNGTTTFGFGSYSMNLTAPLCGSRFYSCVSATAHQAFGEYHFVDATGGQYEGFNYFGAGLLLLLPFALATNWATVKALPRRYPALLAALFLFTIYALSNKVYLGNHELLSYSLPSFMDKLTGTFRASGRFFWIVGYLILFAVLAALLKKPSWPIAVLMAIALSLQWADVQPLRERIALTASKPSKNDLASWDKTMAGVDKIHIYPAFGCGDSDVQVYWFFQRLAAWYGKLLDTGYIARPNVNCVNNERAFAPAFQPRQLYVMSADQLRNPFNIPAGFRLSLQRNECVHWQNAVLCQAGYAPDSWKQLGLQASAIAAPADFNKIEWPAAALPSQIGKLVDGRLVPASRDASGFLNFGPYVTPPPGRYHYVISYASNSDAAQRVGRWDVMTKSGDAASRELASGPLNGTIGKARHIEGSFSIGDAHTVVEIRTFFTGGGDLQMMSISLEKTL